MLELVDLIDGLMRDPSSRLHATLAGWEFPVSREWLLLADLFDMQLATKSKRTPKPYPRPLDKSKNRIGGKNKASHTMAEMRELLARPRVEKT